MGEEGRSPELFFKGGVKISKNKKKERQEYQKGGKKVEGEIWVDVIKNRKGECSLAVKNAKKNSLEVRGKGGPKGETIGGGKEKPGGEKGRGSWEHGLSSTKNQSKEGGGSGGLEGFGGGGGGKKKMCRDVTQQGRIEKPY